MWIRGQRMMRVGLLAVGCALGALALIGGASQSSAQTLDPGLTGAWTANAPDCKRLFERRGGGLAFKAPVDKFAQAAIIEPSRILLPASTCRVQTTSRSKDGVKVTAECNDGISYTNQTMQIQTNSVGGIVYSPTGDPALNTTFVKCPM